VYSTREYGTMWVRLYENGNFDLVADDGTTIEKFIRTNAA
jgi:hypothetical protein